MEATDTVPAFMPFAFQGCNARSLFGPGFGSTGANDVRPVTILVSLFLVWRKVGWAAERNLLILSTGAMIVLSTCWLFFSIAVWGCV